MFAEVGGSGRVGSVEVAKVLHPPSAGDRVLVVGSGEVVPETPNFRNPLVHLVWWENDEGNSCLGTASGWIRLEIAGGLPVLGGVVV